MTHFNNVSEGKKESCWKNFLNFGRTDEGNSVSLSFNTRVEHDSYSHAGIKILDMKGNEIGQGVMKLKSDSIVKNMFSSTMGKEVNVDLTSGGKYIGSLSGRLRLKESKY